MPGYKRMSDIVDKATRSKMISGIRGKNTKPEIFIRKGLHALGFRYRLHSTKLPVKPDLVLHMEPAMSNIEPAFLSKDLTKTKLSLYSVIRKTQENSMTL